MNSTPKYPFRKKFHNFIRKMFPGLAVFSKGIGLLYSSKSFLVTSGYNRSVKLKKPVRKDGSPIPWMNYGVIDLLEQRLNKDLSLYEYGSGNSTLFFASLVKDVTAVECDRGWYEYVSGSMPANVNMILLDPYDLKQYLQIVREQPTKYDVIIVDAADRVDCMLDAPDSLTERGVIILDDSEREDYRSGIETLRTNGFKVLPFNGMKPGGLRAYGTTVFYKDGNCLGL